MRKETDVTRALSGIEAGDPSAAEHLVPLVYDELRKLAAATRAQETPGRRFSLLHWYKNAASELAVTTWEATLATETIPGP